MNTEGVYVDRIELFEVENPIDVYDIQVHGDHSFIVADAVVHNSDICIARDGVVYEVGKGPRPPAHLNCLPEYSLVLPAGAVTGASKRWFEGKMFTVSTRDGREISATPNHPILTDGGWKAIGLLNAGDKLVCLSNPEIAAATVNTRNNNIETSIKDITESFFASSNVSTMPVPITTPDFHGDGIENQIAIVGADRELWNTVNSSLRKESLNLSIETRLSGFCSLMGDSAFTKLFMSSLNPTNSIVSCLREPLPFFGSSSVHPSLLLLVSIPENNSIFSQDSLDGTITDAEFICNPDNANAFGVHLQDIVDVKIVEFSGHVYNLETEKNVYYSNGIVTHNCRSVTTPILKSFKELGINRPELPSSTRASINGQVPAKTTYADWLKRQNAATQDDILGSTKGALFRRGGVTVDRFVDINSGRSYSITELRRREAGAFDKAFGQDE